MRRPRDRKSRYVLYLAWPLGGVRARLVGLVGSGVGGVMLAYWPPHPPLSTIHAAVAGLTRESGFNRARRRSEWVAWREEVRL